MIKKRKNTIGEFCIHLLSLEDVLDVPTFLESHSATGIFKEIQESSCMNTTTKILKIASFKGYLLMKTFLKQI